MAHRHRGRHAKKQSGLGGAGEVCWGPWAVLFMGPRASVSQSVSSMTDSSWGQGPESASQSVSMTDSSWGEGPESVSQSVSQSV